MDSALQKTFVPGSLAAQSATTGRSLAETFVNADVIVIVDTSASMDSKDHGNKSRYERACDELAKVQTSLPGKIAVLSFSDDVMFCPSGKPWNYGGSTQLDRALQFAKVADVDGMQFIVISDGEPADEITALKIAATYKNKIDTIFIGREGDDGQRFLSRLAQASGGQAVKDFAAKQLETSVKGLLNG